jgi:hypothetical protein
MGRSDKREERDVRGGVEHDKAGDVDIEVVIVEGAIFTERITSCKDKG